ncbi:hypothetical protein TNCV_1889772 [Trichonephila clavipes]|nr:hypothetical protein TNCV_1889772 [Trichonephila clavipes]
MRPSQHTGPLGAEVHEQLSRSGGQFEVRPPVFKPPSKLGTHLSTHCSKDEGRNGLAQPGNRTRTCGVERASAPLHGRFLVAPGLELMTRWPRFVTITTSLPRLYGNVEIEQR